MLHRVWNWVVVWLLWPMWLPMAWLMLVLRMGTGQNGQLGWHWRVCRFAGHVALGWKDPK